MQHFSSQVTWQTRYELSAVLSKEIFVKVVSDLRNGKNWMWRKKRAPRDAENAVYKTHISVFLRSAVLSSKIVNSLCNSQWGWWMDYYFFACRIHFFFISTQFISTPSLKFWKILSTLLSTLQAQISNYWKIFFRIFKYIKILAYFQK